MSGWADLGPFPDEEATSRHIVLIREQWDVIKEQHDAATARSKLPELPVCEHDLRFVRVLCSGGGTQLRMQCCRCFFVQAMAVKFEACKEPIERLPLRIALDWNLIWETRAAMREEVTVPPTPRSDFYREYLMSDEWREVRRRVLNRAGGICEGCLLASATEVHHMNYLSLGDELCYDLRALCSTCHEKADRVRKQQR